MGIPPEPSSAGSKRSIDVGRWSMARSRFAGPHSPQIGNARARRESFLTDEPGMRARPAFHASAGRRKSIRRLASSPPPNLAARPAVSGCQTHWTAAPKRAYINSAAPTRILCLGEPYRLRRGLLDRPAGRFQRGVPTRIRANQHLPSILARFADCGQTTSAS